MKLRGSSKISVNLGKTACILRRILQQIIFKAFQRGIRAFVDEYDKQNPDRPMLQINVGMGYNKLRRQVERFKKAISNLSVPPEYSFQDAMQHNQYILYYRYNREHEEEEER